MIAVLAGGVGAARYLRGLLGAVDPATVTALVNTGDDTTMHGLHVSPDIDTVTYTLAGAIDSERGWGLRDESWTAMESLARYAAIRPGGSSAAPTWFNLGDRDLATHFYRTARLAEGARLAEVTAEIARAWGVPIRILPMSDDTVRTFVTLAADCAAGPAGAEIPFQEYFVRHRHAIPVSSIRFDGAESATPLGLDVLDAADHIVIAPSNPLVSIGPIRALRGVDEMLERRRDRVVAVSPIVAGAALKGPADRMLTELGLEPSVVGVADLYSHVCGTLVIDDADAALADDVRSRGMHCIVTDTVMRSPDVATNLARATLGAPS
jgi:LPPG:FO 2-phospho-L-lactate transferase